jgi:hypothetical protein
MAKPTIEVDITVTDMGFEEILDELAKLHKGEPGVSAGFLEGQGGDSLHTDTDLTNAELAVVHEFGSPANNIHPRPFIRQGTDKAATDVDTILVRGSIKIFEGRGTAKQVLEEVGETWEQAIKDEITSGVLEPTKEGDKPLFKTKELYNTITYKVGEED